MKIPEEMAEEYANDWYKDSDYPPAILIHTKRATANVFLAGYKAAKDQLADADKVMCNTTMEEIKAVDTGEIIPITNLPTPAKWISVKDKNPLPKKMVLVCHKNFGVQMGYLDENSVKPCRNHWVVYVREHEEWTGNNIPKTGKYEYVNITHWQPLPAPPKEEK